MAVTRSRSTTPQSLPDDLYYLAPGFPAERLTVAEIKKILRKHHVSSANCNRKAEFVALFKSQVLPKREKILKKHEDTAEGVMNMELATHHNRSIEGEEGSDDDDASARTPQSGEDSDSEATVKQEPQGLEHALQSSFEYQVIPRALVRPCQITSYIQTANSRPCAYAQI